MKIKWTNHHVRKSASIYFEAFMEACCKVRAVPRAAIVDTDEFPKLLKIPEVEFSIGWLHACAEAHGVPIETLYDHLFDELMRPHVDKVRSELADVVRRLTKAAGARRAA